MTSVPQDCQVTRGYHTLAKWLNTEIFLIRYKETNKHRSSAEGLLTPSHESLVTKPKFQFSCC